MPLKSPLVTIIGFGVTCWSTGILLLSAVVPQPTFLPTFLLLLKLLTLVIVVVSAVIQARWILRAIPAREQLGEGQNRRVQQLRTRQQI